MYKGVIFDLDGTILNTIDDLTNSTNYALEQVNYKKRTVEEVLSFVGSGVKLLIKKALNDTNDEELFNKCFEMFSRHYDENNMVLTKPYNGIITLLETLKLKGLKMAIFSNKYNEAVIKMNKHYFNDLFDVAIGESDLIPRKPSTIGVDYILNKLCLSKEEVLYVGDSNVDYQTAKNAKLDVCLVTWGFRSKEVLSQLNPNYLVDSPEEILKIIEKNG